MKTKTAIKIIVAIGIVCLVVGLTRCAPAPTPTCTVNWSCGTTACYMAEGAWSGTGTFTGGNDESDCLAWSTVFLNGVGYPYNKVGSCTCN